MSDERNIQQPTDELSDEQLAEVSGSDGGEGQPARAHIAEAKPKAENKEQYLKITLEDVLISG